jgi:hypothetical protein
MPDIPDSGRELTRMVGEITSFGWCSGRKWRVDFAMVTRYAQPRSSSLFSLLVVLRFTYLLAEFVPYFPFCCAFPVNARLITSQLLVVLMPFISHRFSVPIPFFFVYICFVKDMNWLFLPRYPASSYRYASQA